MATYTVQPDETLGQIASKVKRSRKALHLANHGVIGSNPDNIAPGMVLTIPGRDTDEEETDASNP